MNKIGQKLYRVTEVSRILNVSRSCIMKWIKERKIEAIRVGKLWMIPESELRRFLSGATPGEIRAVIYARVSSHKQEKDGNLERQVERLRSYASARGYRIVDVVTDVASGLKEDRKGLLKLFDLVERGEVDVILVEFRDRLTRFGFEYLKRFFESRNVRIEVVEESEKSYEEELIEDFVAIVTSFAARIYGKRSQKFQRIVKAVKGIMNEADAQG